MCSKRQYIYYSGNRNFTAVKVPSLCYRKAMLEGRVEKFDDVCLTLYRVIDKDGRNLKPL